MSPSYRLTLSQGTRWYERPLSSKRGTVLGWVHIVITKFVDNFVNWNIKDIFCCILRKSFFFLKIALKKTNADLNRWQYIRNHYICGHACRDTGLYQLIYHLLLRSYQNTFNLRFYKRVICKRSVAIIVTCRGQMMSVCWQWALAWNDGLSAEGLSRTERKKNQTNWTIYNLINCTSHRSISMKQYLSLLFDNLSEKGRNIFFIIRKMTFWFTPFIISGDVALDLSFIKRPWKYMYFSLMGWMIKEQFKMSLLGSNEIKTENVRCRNIKDTQISDL